MLLIDGREIKVTEETAFLGNISYNKVNGYNIRFELRFIDGVRNGYINLEKKKRILICFLIKSILGLILMVILLSILRCLLW